MGGLRRLNRWNGTPVKEWTPLNCCNLKLGTPITQTARRMPHIQKFDKQGESIVDNVARNDAPILNAIPYRGKWRNPKQQLCCSAVLKKNEHAQAGTMRK